MRFSGQGRKKLRVQTVESAVAQDNENIALLQLRAEFFDDPVGRGFVKGRPVSYTHLTLPTIYSV